MEAAGLVVGVVSLVGLFNTCLDAVDKASTYRTFRQDARILQTQFNAEKARLEDWGRAIGFDPDQPDGQTPATVTGPLKDPAKAAAVRELLTIIKEVCDSGDTAGRQNSFPVDELDAQPGDDGTVPLKLERPPTNSLEQDPAHVSRRRKAAWALWGKRERSEQVRLVGVLVQQLHNLVPPQNAKRAWNGDDFARVIGLTELRQVLAEWEEKILAETRSDVHDWLMASHTQHTSVFDDAVEDRLEGTCDWILKRPVFSEWLCHEPESTSSTILWIHGPAGFGKTIMCARIVQHLQSQAKLSSAVAYFFFSSNLESRKDPFVAMRSWVAQLMHATPEAFNQVREDWATRQGPQQPATRATVVNIFKKILRALPGCTLVMDGLDECSSTEPNSVPVSKFLEAVREALAAAQSSARLLLVSREDTEIREALTAREDATGEPGLVELKIMPEDVQGDTSALSRNFVDRKLPNKSEEIKADISGRMSQRCAGQFLWLKMQEESGILRKGMNQKQLQRAIDDIPTGLERIYERNWEKICRYPDNERNRAFSLLRWTAFSVRHLTVAELTEAVLLTPEATEFPMDDLPDSVDDEYIDSEILGICGPLLEVRKQAASSPGADAGSRTVHLTHFSVKEFLLRDKFWATDVISANEDLRISNDSKQHSWICRLCIQYINYADVWEQWETVSAGSTLLSYAVTFWVSHARSAPGGVDDPNLTRLQEAFFDEENPCWLKWVCVWKSNPDEALPRAFDLSRDPKPDPLLYACGLGLCSTVKFLVQDKKHDVNGTTQFGDTPLMISCEANQNSTAKALLELGADVTSTNSMGHTALFYASEVGDAEIVKILLERGSDVSAKGHQYQQTALHRACSQGHLQVVCLLLEWGAPVEDMSDGEYAPIHLASLEGHVGIVKRLILHGVNIEKETENGYRPLQLACTLGHLPVVACLLQNGANIRAADHEGVTPLCAAASEGHLSIVKKLVEHAGTSENRSEPQEGGDEADTGQRKRLEYVNEAVSGGLMALHQASYNGHVDVVQFLANEGADVNAQQMPDRLLPLHFAIAAGHLEVVRALIDRGADKTREILRWNTPLSMAAGQGHAEIVELLLDPSKGNTDSERRPYGHIEAAIASNRSEVLEKILSRPEPSLFTKDGHGRLIFSYVAAWFGNTSFIQLLLEKVSFQELNGKDCFGGTPLLAAVKNGHVDIVSVLLSAGRNAPELLTFKDDLGFDALWWARYTDNDEIAELLLQRAESIGLRFENNTAQGLEGTAEAPRKRFIDKSPNLHSCDFCLLAIPNDKNCYRCVFCDSDTCDICEECVELGIKVRPNPHKNQG